MSTNNVTTKPGIVLLHGIWMPAFMMRFLGRGLQKAGFDVYYFSYSGVFSSAEKTLERLRHLVERNSKGPLYFVAHSLGGLLLMSYLRRYPDTSVSGVVLLASPVNGSYAAKSLSKSKLGCLLLGKSRSLLLSGVNYSGTVSIGMITGSVCLGLGRLVCKLDTPCDGAVSVKETRAAWLGHHLVLRQNHAGILFSPTVITNILYFFAHRRFLPDLNPV